jgi:hypothetical protein
MHLRTHRRRALFGAVLSIAACRAVPSPSPAPGGAEPRAAAKAAPGPLIPAERLTTWRPGIPGGVPSRTAVCARVAASAFGDGRQDASAGIQSAIDRCPDGQVVELSAGTFRIDERYLLLSKGITLRGAGPGRTILRRTNGAEPGSYQPKVADPVVIVGPSRWPRPDDATSRPLAADGVQGSDAVTVAGSPGVRAGELVLIDEDHLQTAAWRELPEGAPAGSRISATDRVVWQRHEPPEREDDPFPAAAGWFSRPGRAIAEVKEVARVSGSVVTFTTPLHIGYRVTHAAQLTRYTGDSAHVRNAGLEELTVTGGANGNVRFEAAALCWMRRVESTVWLGEGIALANSFRVEVRDSYVHDAAWPYPGGGGYALSLASGSAEALIENDVVLGANKMMVARAAGAGSVVGYNYLDDGQIASDPDWVEVGLNGSHMAGAHHMLFEGNLCFNYDADNTHGNSIYHTVFRNHLTGFRRSFPGLRNGRTAGLMYGSWWHSFVGNVLGRPGAMDGWTYEDAGRPWGGPSIWKLGYNPIHWEEAPDPQVLSTVLREGNFDYLTNAVHWDTGPQEIPPSLYLTAKPAFFGALPWPWVDATGAVKTATLPAKARFDAGAP